MAGPPNYVTNGEIEVIAASINLTPIATCVTDNRRADNPIIAANNAFFALTGYDRGEVVGQNCRLLAGPATEPEARSALRDAVIDGRPTIVELTNYRKDGTPFRNAVMIAPILDEHGDVVLFYGSQMDVGPAGFGAGLRRDKAQGLVAALSRRQRQVLTLMSTGFRNKQIGFELGIDEKTVKMHRARLLKALQVPTSADAIRLAVEAGFLSNDLDSPQTRQSR